MQYATLLVKLELPVPLNVAEEDVQETIRGDVESLLDELFARESWLLGVFQVPDSLEIHGEQ